LPKTFPARSLERYARLVIKDVSDEPSIAQRLGRPPGGPIEARAGIRASITGKACHFERHAVIVHAGDRPADHHDGPHFVGIVGNRQRELVAAWWLVVPVMPQDESLCFVMLARDHSELRLGHYSPSVVSLHHVSLKRIASNWPWHNGLSQPPDERKRCSGSKAEKAIENSDADRRNHAEKPKVVLML
jgi:hypothetical protein